MATKRQKVQVGIFLTAAAAIFLIVVLALAGFRQKRLDTYYVEFEESIAGLTEGSRVTYRGVSVGKVTDLRVTPENKVGVTIGIDPAKVSLREGVRARYSLLSMFGPYVVDLSGGTDREAKPLEPGAFIPVQVSLMAGLEETFADTIPLTLQRVTKLIERLDTVLSKIKPEDLPNVFHRAEELLANANRAVDDLRDKAADLVASVEKAVRTAQDELEKAGGKAGASLETFQKAVDNASTRTAKLLDTVQATLDENRKPFADALKRLDDTLARAAKQMEGLDLPATAKSIRDAADKLGKGADDVGSAAKSVTSGRDDLRRSLNSIERDLVRSLEELDQTLRSARDLLDTLGRDPAAILRGKRAEP